MPGSPRSSITLLMADDAGRLLDSPAALDYLVEQRGIPLETAKLYRLGYAGEGWQDLLRALKPWHAPEALLAKDAGRAPNWLYSTLDGLVTKSVSRDKVSSMAPSSKTIGDQYVEDSVNVQLVGVTLQQAVGLLHEIEQSATPIHVSRLVLKKRVADPYQFDLTFSVSTIKTAT